MPDTNHGSEFSADKSNYSEDSGSYLIIKGRAIAKQTGINSLFIIIIDEDKSKIVNTGVIASRSGLAADSAPGVPWYIFIENLDNIKLRGDISPRFTADLQTAMDRAMEIDRGDELVTCLKQNEHSKTESCLRGIFLKPLLDNNIAIEFVTENVTQREYYKIIRDRRERQENTHPRVHSLSVKGEVFDVDLVLAPVSGVPINRVTKGDQIMVRIIGNTVKANNYIDNNGLRIDGNVIPQQAEIVEIKRNAENEYMLLCKLNKGIFGRAYETERVKLKTYDEISSQSFPADERQRKSRVKEKSFPLIAIISGALVFVILVVVVLLWFLDVI